MDWRQSYTRQSHIRGIKLFIVNVVCPSLIPVLTDYCRSRSMKVELHGNTSKYRNLPGSGAMGSTTIPIVFQRKTAANFWRIDLPQNCESGQYRYFLTQHQAISASNTPPDCGNHNENWQKTDCCNVLSSFWLEVRSDDFRRRPSPPKARGLSWRNDLLLALKRGLRYFLIKKRKKSNLIFFIILNSIYFQVIQTAVFYQKNTYKNFRPNFFHFFRPPGVLSPKKKLKLRKNLLLKGGLKKLVGLIVKASEIVKEAGQFYVFHTF